MIATLALAAAAAVFAVISGRSPRKCADCGRRGDLTRDEDSRLWHCRSVSVCWGPR